MHRRILTLLLTLIKKVRQQRIRTRIVSPRDTLLATCPETNLNQRQARKLPVGEGQQGQCPPQAHLQEEGKDLREVGGDDGHV